MTFTEPQSLCVTEQLLTDISVRSFRCRVGVDGLQRDVYRAACPYHADQTLVSVSSEDLLLQFSDTSLQSVQCGACGILRDSVERKTQGLRSSRLNTSDTV